MDSGIDSIENNLNFLNKVLSITRVQLQRMTNINIELEVLLLSEREKNQELEEKLKRLEK